MLPHVIGINGFAGSGKDTVADYFIQNHGYTKIAMADAVKDVLSIIFGWDRQMLEGDTKESRYWRTQLDEYWSQQLGYEISPRIAMQRIGTDLFRTHFHLDIWCMIVRRKIMQVNGPVIITDLRFANEIAMANEFQCDMIEVQRGENPPWYNIAREQNICELHGVIDSMSYSMESTFPKVHPSEWKWIGVAHPKYVIQNNSTLEDLYKSIEGLYGDAA